MYLRHEYILIKEIVLDHNAGHAVSHAHNVPTDNGIAFDGMANDQAGIRAQCWTKHQHTKAFG